MVENGFSGRIPYGEPTFHPYVIASVHQNVGFKSMLGDSVRQKNFTDHRKSTFRQRLHFESTKLGKPEN